MKEVRFGKRIKELRLKMGLSQIEAANKLGFKQTTLSNYEGGTSFPKVSDLLHIANFFDITLDDLIYGEGDQEAGHAVIEQQADFFFDLENGMDYEELSKKYNFVVNGSELTDESKKRILEQIEFEYYKYRKKYAR